MYLLRCSCIPGGYPLVLMATSKRNDPLMEVVFLLEIYGRTVGLC
jgi:hypothetical protein